MTAEIVTAKPESEQKRSGGRVEKRLEGTLREPRVAWRHAEQSCAAPRAAEAGSRQPFTALPALGLDRGQMTQRGWRAAAPRQPLQRVSVSGVPVGHWGENTPLTFQRIKIYIYIYKKKFCTEVKVQILVQKYTCKSRIMNSIPPLKKMTYLVCNAEKNMINKNTIVSTKS